MSSLKGPAASAAQTVSHDLRDVPRKDSAGRRFAERTRHSLRCIVAVVQMALRGKFHDWIRIESGKGSQLLNFRFGSFALGNAHPLPGRAGPALLGQGLRE